MSFWTYCKDTQTFYFECLRQTQICTPKLIVSTLMFISTSQKQASSFTFFLRYYNLKNPANLIGQQHFGSILENQNFARYGIGDEISIAISVFILDYFYEKLITKFFKKCQKPYFGDLLGRFCSNLGKNEFSQKKSSVSF